MVVKGDALPGADSRRNEARPRRTALSAELIAILAMGVMLAGVMLTMMTVMTDSFSREIGAVREELRIGQTDLRAAQVELRAGQADLRERMARVESKVDLLAGDWPPSRGSRTNE